MWTVAISLSQRQTGLRNLFQRINAIDPSKTTPHGSDKIAGIKDSSLPISLLATFLRSLRIVGDKVSQLGGWTVQPLDEVRFLQLLQEVVWKRGEEELFRQSYKELNNADYDHLSYEQFQAVLVQIAAQTFYVGPLERSGSFFLSLSEKVNALLDHLEIPSDNDPLNRRHSPTKSTGARLGTPNSLTSTGTKNYSEPASPDSMWIDNTISSTGTRRSSIATRNAQKSFTVSRPATRPGTADSSNAAEYWQRVLGGTLQVGHSRPNSRGTDIDLGLRHDKLVSVSRPHSTDPAMQRARHTGQGQKGIARQWLQQAIRIINPLDTRWSLTKQSIEDFLVKTMKVTPESCDILKPGILDSMFAETDLDKDGTVSIDELCLAVSARFKRRRHADHWRILVRMANQVSLRRKHWPPEVYLNPPIESKPIQPKKNNSIRAQYEDPNNFPDHCGFGPVSFGERKIEKQNAGSDSLSFPSPFPLPLPFPRMLAFSSTPVQLVYVSLCVCVCLNVFVSVSLAAPESALCVFATNPFDRIVTGIYADVSCSWSVMIKRTSSPRLELLSCFSFV